MTYTAKTLKNISSSEEYKALCAAIESKDYKALFNAFAQVSRQMKEAGKEITEKLNSMPRGNKEEERQKFQKAFEQRAQSAVPRWYWINSQIQKENVIDGVVVSIGKKGDPITRTPAGKLVVLSGSKAKEGDKVTFTIVTEGPKISFGREFELTPDTFYLLLNREVLDKVKNSLDEVHKKLESFPGTSDSENLSRMNEILNKLEEVSELTSKMVDFEKERTLSRVQTYRRRLLGPIVEKLALSFLSSEEEKAIRGLCGDDEAKIAAVSTCPGLFSPGSFNAFKEGLFDGENLRGYENLIEEHAKNLDSMEAALKLEDLKADIKELQPQALFYIDGMERLYKRLQFKARQLAGTLMEAKIGSADDLLNKIGEAFSEKELGNELQRVFHSAKEYFDARAATMNLKAKLGDSKCMVNEALLRPYLQQKVAAAFGKK